MASNVFGRPLTSESLEVLPEYMDRKLSQIDRARIALSMKNVDNKDMNARKYGEEMQQRYKGKCTTIVLIYNATGNPLSFSNFHNWFGHLGESPVPYRIENGQWGVFVHGNYGADERSRGGVIFIGKVPDNDEYYEWLLCWSTSADAPSNQVYTDFGNYWGFYTKWNEIDEEMSGKYNFNATAKDGAYLFGSIGDGAHSVVEGTFTLSDVAE